MMPNSIEHIVEPKRLLLTWQSLDEGTTRTRFAVGELTAQPSPAFRYYTEREFFSLNGKSLEAIRSLGYTRYPAFKPERELHTDGVLDAFMRRLPPRSRDDFENYRQHFRLGRGVPISDFALLAVTEAKLPSDGFALVDPLDDTWQRRELLVEVVGHRHYAATCDLDGALGESVQFSPEPANPHDPNAVVVTARGQKAGYINRFQCKAFHVWMREHRLNAVIERMNGEPGYPRIHLFVTVTAAKGVIAA
ncbi:hypothetical protein CN238_22795 [Sinorhizobium meliloti]|nr:hypothetical protein CN238_22795 [Sinorhizobium meliloti]RVH25192.1 hypothetical protein CN214_24105 [Sinorhizobium meliloti]